MAKHFGPYPQQLAATAFILDAPPMPEDGRYPVANLAPGPKKIIAVKLDGVPRSEWREAWKSVGGTAFGSVGQTSARIDLNDPSTNHDQVEIDALGLINDTNEAVAAARRPSDQSEG